MTHICISKLTIIGSVNGLSPGRRQPIISTNDGILLIRTQWTNFSEILIKVQTFSFTEIHLKLSSVEIRPFCLGLNMIISEPAAPISPTPSMCDGLTPVLHSPYYYPCFSIPAATMRPWFIRSQYGVRIVELSWQWLDWHDKAVLRMTRLDCAWLRGYGAGLLGTAFS